jgi:penicillin-binding protein 1A
VFPLGALLIGGAILMLTYAFASIPLPDDIPLKSATKVYDRDGELIGIFSGSERRFIIETDAFMPGGKKEFVGYAVLAAEDRDFFDHNGVSIRGIMRAGWANLTGGEVQQGGSTITQQYVKTAVLQDPARTISRKVKEAILAIKLERRHSKNEILGFYLNTIYLGRGAYGIEAAAEAYFDKPATKLNLGEAAYLAGIIPSPESYQPDEDPEGARARRDRVIDQMVAEGYITEDQAEKAKSKKVKLKGGSESLKFQKAAYFMEWIRKDILEPEFGDDLYTGGLEIHTTLDLDMQNMAEEAVSSVLTEPTDPQASLVSMTPRGEVRAFVGGKAYTNVKKARGFNYAVDPPGHQAGSTAKPFTLLAAIEEGISPTSVFSGSSPRIITEPACNPPWEVNNFGGSSFGTLTLDQATQSSVNTIYAQLVAEIGPEAVADLLKNFGFGKDIDPNCSLALGSIEFTPLEMARGYAGFASMGVLPTVTPVAYVLDSDGECIKEFIPSKAGCDREARDKRGGERVVEENSAAVLTQILTHVVQGGTAPQAAQRCVVVLGLYESTRHHRLDGVSDRGIRSRRAGHRPRRLSRGHRVRRRPLRLSAAHGLHLRYPGAVSPRPRNRGDGGILSCRYLGGVHDRCDRGGDAGAVPDPDLDADGAGEPAAADRCGRGRRRRPGDARAGADRVTRAGADRAGARTRADRAGAGAEPGSHPAKPEEVARLA